MAIRWGLARIGLGSVAALSGFVPHAAATAVPVYTGKVVMEDGSAPGRPVAIERTCGEKPEHLADTNAKGEYSWHARSSQTNVQLSSLTGGNAVASMMFNVGPNQVCVIRATMPGYESNQIQVEDVTMLESPLLPTLVLVRRGSGVNFESLSANVPRAASGPWNRAEKEIRRKNWNQAEQELHAVVTAAPKFAPGWATLGDVQQLMRKKTEARESYQNAVNFDPHLISVLLMLSRMQVEASDWPAAAKTAAALAKEDGKKKYPEAYIFQALASFHRENLDQAASFAEEAVRIDKRHDVPLTEYVLGLILEAKKDLTGAKEHLAKFVEIDPRAPEVPAATAHMGNLGATNAVSLDIGAALDGAAAGMKLEKTAEAWVPGGIAAMSKMAGLTGTITSQNFFTEFCRALVGEGSSETAGGIPLYKGAVREYMSTIAALMQLGDHRDNTTIVRLSLGTPEDIDRTSRALPLVGWRVSKSGGGFRVEPGSQPSDSTRLEVLPALGVDSVSMQEALESGKPFSFEIPSEQARLFGGNSWIELLVNPNVPGGIAAAFTLDIRLAQTYAALASMQADAAADLVAGVGLRNLVTRDSAAVLHSAGAFEVADKSVAVPGGKEAEPAWRELAGANPKEPPSFFRAVLEKDQGTLANFYALLAKTDAAHQKSFLSHLARFYAWYRDSHEYREGIAQPPPGWRARLFRELPLDDAGNVHFPGGRSAWTDSPIQTAESLLTVGALEALVPVANLEAKRKSPLDETSVRALGQHYSDWRGLFPVFEKLPALNGDDFTALEHFSDAVRSLSRPQQNIVMAEWDALVELMVLGMEAGAPVPPTTFRSICARLSGPDSSKHAVALLHEMAGEGDLDQVVPSRFLRLSSDRMAGFEHVMALQHVPRLSAAKNEPELAAALSGIVYAASLDSKGLLVNEDPKLLAKHRFTEPNLFAPPQLVKANHGPGSYFAGGLMNLRAVGKGLTPGGRAVVDLSSDASAPSGTAPVTVGTSAPAETVPSEVIFRADGRLVEVFATVTDSSGHYVDDLTKEQFTILDRGKEAKVIEFEPRSAEVSVALLLDTTGSMHDALPALKSAALKLIDELRPSDSVAVYSFNSAVQELQPFTTEKAPAKRAVLGTRPFGETALYDALTRVGRDLSGRAGKKVIVLFTDGDDNSSSLTTDIAVRRAKAAGIPVYTIAQGVALTNTTFVQQLATISKATGAESFVIRQPQEIKSVFERVSEALSHGYLLIFQPDAADDATWRPLEVGIKGVKGGKVRAREGYYP